MHITVLGGGAWGTTLAKVLTDFSSNKVTLWTENPLVINSITQYHQNKIYLPDIQLSANISVTRSIEKALEGEILFIVIPSQGVRALLTKILPYLTKEVPIVICSKGIEVNSTQLMSEVSQGIVKNEIFILAGPNLAKEVALQLPAAAILAGSKTKWRNIINKSLNTNYFKVLETSDIIGVQVAGALKNVIAIACGIIEGKKWGENAKAALVTLGFQEMLSFCKVKGGEIDTLSSVCGIGDLFLTCNSQQSRNMRYGYKLGSNKVIEGKEIVEGVYTAKSIFQFSKQHELHFPLCSIIYKIIYEKLNIEEGFSYLY